MCDPILVTLLKMQPHSSQSSRENATPSSGTSPLASYKEVTPPGFALSYQFLTCCRTLLFDSYFYLFGHLLIHVGDCVITRVTLIVLNNIVEILICT